jgi:hypothetical protein
MLRRPDNDLHLEQTTNLLSRIVALGATGEKEERSADVFLTALDGRHVFPRLLFSSIINGRGRG